MRRERKTWTLGLRPRLVGEASPLTKLLAYIRPTPQLPIPHLPLCAFNTFRVKLDAETIRIEPLERRRSVGFRLGVLSPTLTHEVFFFASKAHRHGFIWRSKLLYDRRRAPVWPLDKAVSIHIKWRGGWWPLPLLPCTSSLHRFRHRANDALLCWLLMTEKPL